MAEIPFKDILPSADLNGELVELTYPAENCFFLVRMAYGVEERPLFWHQGAIQAAQPVLLNHVQGLSLFDTLFHDSE